jgi:hypothetical protein
LGKRGNEVVTAVVERGNKAEEDERDRERQRGEVVGEGRQRWAREVWRRMNRVLNFEIGGAVPPKSGAGKQVRWDEKRLCFFCHCQVSNILDVGCIKIEKC